MKYRREIDGLRAIAVLPVLFFHAGFEVFSGGYVGVDVFFVISGYLITSILIEELDRSDFSIIRFYERRARRILPALFVVMLACLPFSYMWMVPEQLEDFAQSLVAVVFFVSNVLFWREEGYFAPAAELKPLLHTWSLAVEEQYYLLFPLFLLLMWRFGRNIVFWSVIVIAALSFLLAEWGWRNSPTANFYLAPTRTWELLAGSICAFLSVGSSQRSSNVLGAAGLGLILFAVFSYDALTPSPSIYTLAPVVGSSLIILFAAEKSWVGRLLSLRVFVGLGLISYSTYLWHQPLFAFARLRSLKEPSDGLMAGLIVVTLLLAWFTWYWVERIFRNRAGFFHVSRRDVFLASGVVGAMFVTMGLVGYFGKGLEWRFSNDVLAIMNVREGDTTGCYNLLSEKDMSENKECRLGAIDVNPTVAIVGDSHASVISDALSERLEQQGLSAVTYNGSWCAPLINFATNFKGKDKCLGGVNAAIERMISRPDIKTIVLYAEWANYLTGLRWPEQVAATYVYEEMGNLDFSQSSLELNGHFFNLALERTLNDLGRSGKRVIVVLPVPEHEVTVSKAALGAKIFGYDVNALNLPVEDYIKRSGEVREALQHYGSKFGAVLIDPLSIYCRDDVCPITDDAGRALYTDGNHLSYLGSVPLADSIVDALID